MTQIVCLSQAPWQAIPTRTQQFMSRMRDAEVLFFEPPAERSDHNYKKPGRQMRPNVTVYTLPPMWSSSMKQGFLFQRDCQRLGTFIQSKEQEHRFREPLLWAATPLAIHLLDYLAYKSLVYDCDRYWTEFPLQWESDLALASDLIFAASAGLVDRLSPCSSNIALLPNGCNYPMFCREDLDTPPGLAELQGPVMGFCGTIWKDLDLSPVVAIARRHPEWNILLLGRTEHNPALATLQGLPNVRFLGRRPLLEVPEYVQRFHVCLDLRRTGSLGDDVIPSRVYEYFAAGKPVVRMCFPGQMAEFPDVMSGVYDNEEFIRACEAMLVNDAPWLPLQRRDYGAAAAWNMRADQILHILENSCLC
ncbi:MAG: glycosyltransferase [Oscillospiraceae bacterium]